MAPMALALYLDAPLQSWGYQSRFDRRTTLSYPTRSGILGMICAAMGIPRPDTEALQELDVLEITVLGFGRPTTLVDYHTVGGGYDRNTQPGMTPRTAENKVGNNMQTYREYLQDARFGVVLAGPSALLSRIGDALRDPIWGIWLGRKCCIPATPVYQGLFDTVKEAEAHLIALETERIVKPTTSSTPSSRAETERRATDTPDVRVPSSSPSPDADGEGAANAPDGAPDGSPLRIRRIVEVDSFEAGSDTLNDRPLDFARRIFGVRRVLDQAEG